MKNIMMMILIIVSWNNAYSHSVHYNFPDSKKLQINTLEHNFEDGYQEPTQSIQIEVHELLGINSDSVVFHRIEQAIKIIDQIMNSDEFKLRVTNFKNSQNENKYASNNGLSNEQIYAKLMEARELLSPDTPGVMNLHIKKYNRSFSRVIGYTLPGKSKYIYVNWKFYKNFSVSNIAANLVHEWIHLMGFYHDSAKDHESVPYAIGYMVGDLAQSVF